MQCAAAAAGCGLARTTSATSDHPVALVDTHVYLGHWPLAQLDATTPEELVARLQRENIRSAWVGSFDGLFHKDIHAVNARLVDACRTRGGELLVPVGSINPALPDWEEDLRRCHDVLKMPAVRLHPTYHGYALNDPRLAQLLEQASKHSLLVQIVTQLPAAKHRLLTPAAKSVPLSPLAAIARSLPNLRLIISGPPPHERATTERFAEITNVYFDVASASTGNELARLSQTAASNRLVYGTAAPLNSNARSLQKRVRSSFSADQWRDVGERNAAMLKLR